MNKIKSLVLFSKLVTPVLSCSTGNPRGHWPGLRRREWKGGPCGRHAWDPLHLPPRAATCRAATATRETYRSSGGARASGLVALVHQLRVDDGGRCRPRSREPGAVSTRTRMHCEVPRSELDCSEGTPEGLGFSVREDRGTTLSSFKRHGDSFPPTKPTSLAWRQGSSQDGALPASAVCPSPHVCVTHQACALSPAAPLPVTVLCLPHSFPLTPCQGAQNPTSERFSPRTTFLSGHLLRRRGFQHHLGRATQFPPANQSPPEFQTPPSFPPEHSSWVFCGCGC